MHESLTDRELEILHLLEAGLSDRDIAERLVFTLGTVKWYNRQIYGKLGVRSRTQAIAQARGRGLLIHETADQTAPSLLIVHKHNLPASLTHFIGREQQLEDIQHLLGKHRLVTLTGSPGTGKTRLSLHIASELLPTFADGVYFVSLAPILDAGLVANAIASALGINEIPNQPLPETLKAVLRKKAMLLVLDNFEHLLASAPLVSELLREVPGMKILATSREALHLYGEQEYAVPPMQLPNLKATTSPNQLTDYEAVALFVQTARAASPAFELTPDNAAAVAQTCIRLDGLPLAIELAAARVKHLSPKKLLERLNTRLDTLTGGSRDLPTRQQTLRQMIDWSYDLLNAGEKWLFARLGIFVGGWTLEAAEAVCGEGLQIDTFNGLASLVDKSLVRQEESPHGEPRFMMLETLREYAVERLHERGETALLSEAHAHYYRSFAEQVHPELYKHNQTMWLRRMVAEQENFRLALNWAVTERQAETGLRLINVLARFWYMRGLLVEGWQWSVLLLAMGDDAPPDVRAWAFIAVGRLAHFLGDFSRAEALCRQGLALARQVGDGDMIGTALSNLFVSLLRPEMPRESAQQLSVLVDEAYTLAEQAHNHQKLGMALIHRGALFRFQGEYEAAKGRYEQSIALYRELGDLWMLTVGLLNLGTVLYWQKKYSEATTHFLESLTICQQMDDIWGVAISLEGIAGALGQQGEPIRAARLLGAGEALRESLNVPLQADDQAYYDHAVAAVQAQLGEAAFAAAWLEGRMMTVEAAVAMALKA
jgi:predicted ATPase/DNA-binding CsgD family transcriptional regulator